MSEQNFLEKIKILTAERILQARKFKSIEVLKSEIEQMPEALNLVERFRRLPGPQIIAEVKRQSPSKGQIAIELDPVEVALGYQRAGATAISVLTEPHYFGGSVQDLKNIREALPYMPLLMKDFVIDRYQILQARALGADTVLLMYSLLGESELRRLYEDAKSLGMEPLVEVHDEKEFELALTLGASLIGVNNRNLKTLDVDLETSTRLLKDRHFGNIVLISESGIETAQQIRLLGQLGYRGFLMGTQLMKDKQPESTLRNLLAEAS
jgi:indole-3-glycerol phosphate synthase